MQNIYDHIKKRVFELAYTDFTVQPVILKTEAGKQNYEIQAYNELYFLMSDLPVGTRIISDTNAIESDISFSNSSIRAYHEFSGYIEIIFPSATNEFAEFLRVIMK